MPGNDALAFTTAVNTLAAAMAQCLNDSELALAAAVLTQLGDTLATIAAQRSLCGKTPSGTRSGVIRK